MQCQFWRCRGGEEPWCWALQWWGEDLQSKQDKKISTKGKTGNAVSRHLGGGGCALCCVKPDKAGENVSFTSILQSPPLKKGKRYAAMKKKKEGGGGVKKKLGVWERQLGGHALLTIWGRVMSSSPVHFKPCYGEDMWEHEALIDVQFLHLICPAVAGSCDSSESCRGKGLRGAQGQDKCLHADLQPDNTSQSVYNTWKAWLNDQTCWV